ncbi:MAG: zinc-ribbon domain-containing protein [Candidatus Sulfotelmatobacter sp.]
MPIPCPDCAAEMPDDAAFCPGCGRAMHAPERAHGTVGGLPETMSGALAYFLVVPAIVFLLIQPFSKNRFVRFHSFQCLGFCLVGVVIGAALRILGVMLAFIPAVGHLLVALFTMLVSLAFFVVWVVLVVKALQGEMFKLPLVGDFAEKQAAAV